VYKKWENIQAYYLYSTSGLNSSLIQSLKKINVKNEVIISRDNNTNLIFKNIVKKDGF